jgi:hypothetical protein
MSAEQVSNLKFELGHVLFIDIIGYSKLLITEQSKLLRCLTDVVRETGQFRAACKTRFSLSASIRSILRPFSLGMFVSSTEP